jgi:hypothetical protein
LSVDKNEYTFAKKEADALYGYIDFWGNFIPGLLRTELPVMEVKTSSEYMF